MSGGIASVVDIVLELPDDGLGATSRVFRIGQSGEQQNSDKGQSNTERLHFVSPFSGFGDSLKYNIHRCLYKSQVLFCIITIFLFCISPKFVYNSVP